ncbi:MAG: tetratricopeptide repeat protein [Pseudomonadota bacterium]
MSLILNALKRTQRIRWERRERKQSFGKNLPWLSRWSRREITPQQRFLIIGLALATVLLFIFVKAWVRSPPATVSLPAAGHKVTLPISQSPLEELKAVFIEVPLEEVPITSPSPVSLMPAPSEEKADKRVAVAIPKSPKPKANLSEPTGKPSMKRQDKRVIPRASHPPIEPEPPVQQKLSKAPAEIQPGPGHEAVRHFNLGLLYHKNHKLNEALEEYKTALAVDPLNVQAHNNIGMVYKDLRRLDEAVVHYQKALSINPTYEKAHHNLAVAYYLNGDLEKGILEYQLAMDIDPSNPETYNNLGLIYRKQKELYRAKKIFQKGLSIDPDYAPIHYNLALVLEDEGEWKDATRHYRKFVAIAPEGRQALVEKVKRHLETLSSHEK